jgi:threonine dehydratase
LEKTTVTLEDIQSAAKRIAPYVRRTPLLRQEAMGKLLGCDVYLKPEMLQVTGAFKLRGAMSKILALTPEERAKGIITSSSGNHGQACAFAGEKLGMHVTVLVPNDTPLIKVNNARRMGAEVILWDRSYDKRWAKVHEEVAEHGYTIVHPYEDPMVMAGQGTIALEIMEDLEDLDTIIVPIGGGGLISGISTAVKALKPSVRVIGVQASASAAYAESRKVGKPVEVPCLPTVADGLSCRRPGNNPYPIIEKNVDDIVAVEEKDILEATKMVAKEAKLVAEPSACVGIGAILGGKIKVRPDEKVAFVLTSGNWDIDMLGKVYNDIPVEGVE